MAKSHIEKTRKRESDLLKHGDYAGRCETGFKSDIQWRHEIHHIICEHSIERRPFQYKKTDGPYIEDCLWITKWDINNAGNLIGLPRNRQYKESNGSEPSDMPSHQVDHNTKDGYTSEVEVWLKNNVWDTLNAKKKDHDTDAAAIADQLSDGSEIYRDLLDERGKRSPGTILGWQKRFDPAYKDTWYHPFSMGDVPSRRHAGVSATDLTNVFKKLDKP